VQKRKKALEERNNRVKKAETSTQDDDDGALDRLINTLRDGGSVKTRRRPRPTEVDTSLTSDPNETYNAKDMLEQLKAGGFMTTPLSPTTPTPSQLRRLRRRTERGLDGELLEFSPLVLDDLQDDPLLMEPRILKTRRRSLNRHILYSLLELYNTGFHIMTCFGRERDIYLSRHDQSLGKNFHLHFQQPCSLFPSSPPLLSRPSFSLRMLLSACKQLKRISSSPLWSLTCFRLLSRQPLSLSAFQVRPLCLCNSPSTAHTMYVFNNRRWRGKAWSTFDQRT
jgi:hypothetical protein